MARGPTEPIQDGEDEVADHPTRPVRPGRLTSSQALRLETRTLERAVHRTAAIVFLAVGLLAALLPHWRAQTSLALVAWAVCGASYYALAWLRPGVGRAALDVVFEVTLASGPVLIIALLEPPGSTAQHIGFGAYYVAITLAAVRLSPRLVALAVALAIVQYLAIVLALLAPDGGAAFVMRLGWLVLTGVVAALGSRHLRRMTVSVVGERQERQRVETALGRFVSRDVAQVILQGGATAPQRRAVTVLFCDLRGFTFLCERERPEDVVELLNTFYERACAIVERNGGTVNKLLGDGLLALFGAPHEVPSHADAAAAASVELMGLVGELRQRGGVWTHLAIGIGVDTGEVVLGPIGSRTRAEYTAIGSPVNRAARLQSLGEREGRRIIVSAATRRALRHRHKLVALGEVTLKGFAAPEMAYYLAGRATSMADATAAVPSHPAGRRLRPRVDPPNMTPTPSEITMAVPERTGATGMRAPFGAAVDDRAITPIRDDPGATTPVNDDATSPFERRRGGT